MCFQSTINTTVLSLIVQYSDIINTFKPYLDNKSRLNMPLKLAIKCTKGFVQNEILDVLAILDVNLYFIIFCEIKL